MGLLHREMGRLGLCAWPNAPTVISHSLSPEHLFEGARLALARCNERGRHRWNYVLVDGGAKRPQALGQHGEALCILETDAAVGGRGRGDLLDRVTDEPRLAPDEIV